ncbi:hypothetical protein QS306_14750 [Paraburkholderia bonniea]|uniref:hypothetical protein n=1 Tax=Paraburkholderia bonniea TaxID=2152891 RepID=UPI00129219D6|nr:hypothetical protein [Paraburkholderia bonniea]WJF92022.1 hypothetical protein QS306_14750 [Paraburkholderia bonniea]WJF95342.1 hypothetical protein QS308_14755 [Paraburkholderia bonniea]
MKSPLLLRCGTLCFVLLLSACSWPGFLRHPEIASAPVDCALSVAPSASFIYGPTQGGRLSANRVANTAMTSIILKQSVSAAVRDAVKASLVVAQVGVNNPHKVLSGRIEQFSVDDLRAPANWSLKIRYVLTDSSTHKTLYQSTQTVKQRAAKFTSNEGALSDTVNLSVKALVSDPAFISAMRAGSPACTGSSHGVVRRTG